MLRTTASPRGTLTLTSRERVCLQVAALSLAMLMVACGDETNAAGGGQAGVGGSGNTTTTSMGAGGSPAFEPYHSCTSEDGLTDLRGQSPVTVGFGFMNTVSIYDPPCVLIDAGTLLTFESFDGSTFQIHPLQGGVSPNPDPDSPFGLVLDPITTTSYTLPTPGNYPYYCVAHASEGMAGAVYVR